MNLRQYAALHKAVTEARALDGASIGKRVLFLVAEHASVVEEATEHLVAGTTPPQCLMVGDYIVDFDTGAVLEGSTGDVFDVVELKETFGDDLVRPWTNWTLEVVARIGQDPWPGRRAYLKGAPPNGIAHIINEKAPKEPVVLSLVRKEGAMMILDQNQGQHGVIYGAGTHYDTYRAAVSAVNALEQTLNNPTPDDTTLFKAGDRIGTRRELFPVVEGLEPLPETTYSVELRDAQGAVHRSTYSAQTLEQALEQAKARFNYVNLTSYRITRPTEWRFGAWYYTGTTERAEGDGIGGWVDVAAAAA